MLKKMITGLFFICVFSNLSYATIPSPYMQHNTLTIIINKPVEKVFEFAINPNNTPRWYDSIQAEKTNEWPVRLGTVYRNRGKEGPWIDFKVTKFIKNREIELKKYDSNYHVNYSFAALPGGVTRIIYHEWVTEGVIYDPLDQAKLNKLKLILEEPAQFGQDHSQHVVENFYRYFNASDMDNLALIIDDNIEHEMNYQGVQKGKQAFLDFIQLSKKHYDEKVENIILMASDNDQHVTAKFTTQGKYVLTDSSAIPASGQKYELSVINYFEVQNGKITKARCWYDDEAWKRQVSANVNTQLG